MSIFFFFFFFFKQKTAYEITYGDWSSDVCSSDLVRRKERRAEARRLVDEEQCERERGAGTEGKKPRGAPAARRLGGRADGERDDDRENRVFRDQRPAGEESREDGAAVSLSRVCL